MRGSSMTIETLGGEELLVGRQGADVAVAVIDERFGRIAGVRVNPDQAAALAWVLLELASADSPARREDAEAGR